MSTTTAEPTTEPDHKTGTSPTAETPAPASEPTPETSSADHVPPSSQSAVAVPSRVRRFRRSWSVEAVILATLAVIYSMYFARAVLLPIVMALMLTLLFRPVVRRARRFRVPEVVAAALTLMTAVLVFGGGAMFLIGPAKEWIDSAPENLQKVGTRLHVIREQIDQINEASEKVHELAEGKPEEPSEPDPYPFTRESAAEDPAETGTVADKPREASDQDTVAATVEAGSDPLTDEADRDEPDQPVPVEVRQPRLMTGLAFLSSTGSLLAEVVATLVLAFFLLSSGDVLINNVLRILPTFREKRNAVELVHSVEQGISSYLLTVSAINLGLGCVIGVAMWLLGVPNPALWGAMAALFNFVPFVGALVGTVIMFLVAVLSFDSLSYAALVPLVYFGLTALEGNVITPHLLGRSMSLNPIMVFLSLTFWGWMWGIGGAVLAVPILATLKVGFDQFERTRPLGTLLGGRIFA